ncbi:penicillin-binding protein 2 [Yunchengibacter salinarum]|uniref:penicillin-binding protein 2 n=1 Tax=Yunchengibacter salinarum TaxID=3133399 RepID=UPI0035B63177
MAREAERYQLFTRRALLLAGAQGLALAGLGGRLYYLAVVQGDELRLRADKNRISLRLIAPERGEILDRHGRKLATNRQDYRVVLIPERAGVLADTLAALGRIAHLNDRQLSRVRTRVRRQRAFVPVVVASGLDWDTFSRINVAMPDLPGVMPDAGLSRFYPDGETVAHLVGYVGTPSEDDLDGSKLLRLPGFKIGRDGLEKQLDPMLRGEAGTRRVEVNSVGREIRELPPRTDARRGADVPISIDLALQDTVMAELGEEAAGVVALDIHTGEVLAMGSSPAFDPNEFSAGISRENWSAMLRDPRKPLLNKCLAGQFPPGSTIKMLVALTALERGIITEDTDFYCGGKHRLGNHTFHCWKRRGHGRLTLLEGIAQSCDVYFYKLAEQLEVDHIAETASRFGLGQIFNIGLEGQKSGLLPTRAWKRAVKGEPWQKGETLVIAIGQGAMLATPLQLAVMTARIASGRRVTPTLGRVPESVSDAVSMIEPMDTSPLHLRSLRRAMEMVTEPGGTAHDWRRARSAPKLAGKTGTAQVRRISQAERDTGVKDNEELPWQYRDHALFVGYGPVDNPRVAVSVLVQHGGGGSSTAAPIARKVLDRALELGYGPGGRRGVPGEERSGGRADGGTEKD